MEHNPYASPQSGAPLVGPSRSSRLRRRLFGIALMLAGCVALALREFKPITATLAGPALFFYGLAGALYPLAIPDPKKEFGVMQGWIDFGRKEARFGFAALFFGFLCGVFWLVF